VPVATVGEKEGGPRKEKEESTDLEEIYNQALRLGVFRFPDLRRRRGSIRLLAIGKVKMRWGESDKGANYFGR